MRPVPGSDSHVQLRIQGWGQPGARGEDPVSEEGGPLNEGGGGSLCQISMLRNNNVAVWNLGKAKFKRNDHVPCHK